tara:strand:- start:35 stop:427 length:393 start_codon:yes stop_codon:yes gene_type:complete
MIYNKDVPPGHEKELNNLAIDFDGVIHTFDKGYHDGTCYGQPIAGTKEALEELSKKYNIIIFSSKVKPDRPLVNNKTGMQLVKDWLKQHDLLKYVSEITCEKPRAKYYIDDKAIEFLSWDLTLTRLRKKQ